MGYTNEITQEANKSNSENLDALTRRMNELFKGHIILIGFMGTGKSTISQYLSKVTGLEVVDTDAMIAQKEGKSIPKIFEEHGEPYFRDCETNTLIELQEKEQLIISCGGGIVLREENTLHMRKTGKIVLLTASPETILERVKDNNDRPILNNNMNTEFIEELLNKRKDKYLHAADIIIETDGKNVHEIVQEILFQLTNIK